MVAGLELPRRDWMKGRAMGRNLMLHAKLMMMVVGAVEACRILHLPLWSWLDPALLVWSRGIVLGAGVLVVWNVNAFSRGAPERAALRAKERDLARLKMLATRYPPPQPLLQPGNSMQEASARMGMLQAAMVQGQVSMAARAGQPARLRYMLPPLITMTGPQTTHDGVNFVTPSTRRLTGACGKCGQPMSRHSYYGRSLCRYQPLESRPVHVRACESCGAIMMLEDREQHVVYCELCGQQGV